MDNENLYSMIRYVVVDMQPGAATHNGVLRDRHSKKEIKVIATTCIIFIFRSQSRSEMAAS